MMDERSERNLQGVHHDLVRVIRIARKASPDGFIVTEGLRSKERQRELVRQGKSRTLNSRHLTGHAVDIAALDASGKVTWDLRVYARIARVVKATAGELNIPITWGGDWRGLVDGPHFELSRRAYS